MTKSEIDDIFAAKGKANPSEPVPSSSQPKEKKKRKKDKKKESESPAVKPSTKRRAVETVVDPSSTELVAPSAKRPRDSARPSSKPKKSVKEDEDRFKDSRGTGPRRKTEEGFTIYKESELGISHEGGDTPLCPFDCECCF